MSTKRIVLRTIVRALGVAIAFSMFNLAPAKAEGYLGGMIGWGWPLGTEADVDSGLGYGGTIGYRIIPELSIAATFIRDDLETSFGGIDHSVNHYLGEANFFTVFGLNGGLHIGPVTTNVGPFSSTDLGFGGHLGMDFKLTEDLSIGANGYWTYVTASDKYSTLNVMFPVKVWF